MCSLICQTNLLKYNQVLRKMTLYQSIPSFPPLIHFPPSEIGIFVKQETGAV